MIEGILISGAVVFAALAGVCCWYAIIVVRREERERYEQRLRNRRD